MRCMWRWDDMEMGWQRCMWTWDDGGVCGDERPYIYTSPHTSMDIYVGIYTSPHVYLMYVCIPVFGDVCIPKGRIWTYMQVYIHLHIHFPERDQPLHFMPRFIWRGRIHICMYVYMIYLYYFWYETITITELSKDLQEWHWLPHIQLFGENEYTYRCIYI